MISSRKLALVAISTLGLALGACGTATDTPESTSAGSAPAAEESTAVGTTTAETSTAESSPAESSAMESSAATEANSSTTNSEFIDPTAEVSPIVVDPARFQVNGQHLFSYTAQNAATGTCLVTADGATCTGVAGAAVPNIANPPFAGQRPGAVSASMGGLHYTILEGLPPAPASLSPGERLVVDAVSCEVSAARDVTCTSGDTSFTISGVDRSIIA